MSLEDLIKKAQGTFLHQFGGEGRKVTLVAAPSRLTLLGGEYTEAVDGFSLVAGGSHSVVVAAQRSNDIASEPILPHHPDRGHLGTEPR